LTFSARSAAVSLYRGNLRTPSGLILFLFKKKKEKSPKSSFLYFKLHRLFWLYLHSSWTWGPWRTHQTIQ